MSHYAGDLLFGAIAVAGRLTSRFGKWLRRTGRSRVAGKRMSRIGKATNRTFRSGPLGLVRKKD